LDRKNPAARRVSEWVDLAACSAQTITGTTGMSLQIQIGSANFITVGKTKNWIAAETALIDE
jgi:hypothetical protein